MAKKKPTGGRLLRTKRMRKKALSPIRKSRLRKLFALVDELLGAFDNRPSIFVSRGGACRNI